MNRSDSSGLKDGVEEGGWVWTGGEGGREGEIIFRTRARCFRKAAVCCNIPATVVGGIWSPVVELEERSVFPAVTSWG